MQSEIALFDTHGIPLFASAVTQVQGEQDAEKLPQISAAARPSVREIDAFKEATPSDVVLEGFIAAS